MRILVVFAFQPTGTEAPQNTVSVIKLRVFVFIENFGRRKKKHQCWRRRMRDAVGRK